MEKIKIGDTLYDLVPMGLNQSDKDRSFTISSELPFVDIVQTFTDVTSIQHLSETDEILSSYLDGVSVKTITRDFENGTYTIVVSTDAVVAEIKSLRDMIIAMQLK